MRVTRRKFLITTMVAAPAILLPGMATANPHPEIGLIFVGASWCPVCHAAAAVLAPAAERSGLDILVASQDGKPIAPWPAFVDARGNRITASITAIPVLLFVDLAQGKVLGQIAGFQSPGQYLGAVRATLASAVRDTRG